MAVACFTAFLLWKPTFQVLFDLKRQSSLVQVFQGQQVRKRDLDRPEKAIIIDIVLMKNLLHAQVSQRNGLRTRLTTAEGVNSKKYATSRTRL